MKAQQLTRRATHLKRQSNSDGFGGKQTEYVVVAAFWCEPTYVNDTQFSDFQRTTTRLALNLEVRIETSRKISVDDRIIYDGRTFAVVGILPDNRQVFATLNLESTTDAD